MKKILLAALAILALSSVDAGAWGKRIHATIAYIAEKHMTPKAKKTVQTLLGDESMVGVASNLDYYRQVMRYNLTPPATHNGKTYRTLTIPPSLRTCSTSYILSETSTAPCMCVMTTA